MTKTKFAIATISLSILLTCTALRQGNRKPPRQINNPFGVGGTTTMGVKTRRNANLGDTATHEVGHRGKRRLQSNSQSQQVRSRKKNQDIEVENDETHRTRPRTARTETVNNNETLNVSSRGKRRKAFPKATP